MKCQICDKSLNDYEATRKDVVTGEYLDTCSECLSAIRESLQDFEEDMPYRYDVGLDDEIVLDNEDQS